MRNMFAYCSFNQPLNNWDVSNVNTMERMFWTATYFNQPLNNWDVSYVEDMAWMFMGSLSFSGVAAGARDQHARPPQNF